MGTVGLRGPLNRPGTPDKEGKLIIIQESLDGTKVQRGKNYLEKIPEGIVGHRQMTFKLDRSCVTYHCIISPLQTHGENRRQYFSAFLSEREGSFLRREHCRLPAGGRHIPVSGVGSGLAVCDDTQERRPQRQAQHVSP